MTEGTLLYFKSWRGPQAASGIIIEKLSYALTQLILVVRIVMILWKIPLTPGLSTAVLTGTSLLGAGIIGFLVVQKYGKLGTILRWLVARVGRRKTCEIVPITLPRWICELKRLL